MHFFFLMNCHETVFLFHVTKSDKVHRVSCSDLNSFPLAKPCRARGNHDLTWAGFFPHTSPFRDFYCWFLFYCVHNRLWLKIKVFNLHAEWMHAPQKKKPKKQSWYGSSKTHQKHNFYNWLKRKKKQKYAHNLTNMFNFVRLEEYLKGFRNQRGNRKLSSPV